MACYLGFPAGSGVDDLAGDQSPALRVLTLLRPQSLQLPNGWRVVTAEPWPVVTGDAVRLDATGLTMGSWRVVPVRQWRPAVVARVPAASPSAAIRRLSHHWLPTPSAEVALPTGLDLYAGALAVGTAIAADPATLRGGSELDAAVAALVGLGPGSTPSGDDVLCGVALTLRLLGETKRLDALAASVRPRLGATNGVSAQLLEAALLGYAVPQVTELLRLLGRPPQSDDDSPNCSAALVDALEQVTRIGHSSGTDLLTGIHATLTALSPP